MPVAATSSPISGGVRLSCWAEEKICWSSHELRFVAIQAIEKIRPMSPIRLYSTACRAAVLASARPYHQPIRRKDIIPTPSHPMKIWNMLFAEIKISIAIRNINRYLKNRAILGSECMYQRANSRMAQVTYRATGMNITE